MIGLKIWYEVGDWSTSFSKLPDVCEFSDFVFQTYALIVRCFEKKNQVIPTDQEALLFPLGSSKKTAWPKSRDVWLDGSMVGCMNGRKYKASFNFLHF